MTTEEERALYQEGLDLCDILIAKATEEGNDVEVAEQTTERMWLMWATHKLVLREWREAHASNT